MCHDKPISILRLYVLLFDNSLSLCFFQICLKSLSLIVLSCLHTERPVKRSYSKDTARRAINVVNEKVNMKTTDKETSDTPGVNSGSGSVNRNVSNCRHECGDDHNLPIMSSAAGLVQSGCSGHRSKLSSYDQHPMNCFSSRRNSWYAKFYKQNFSSTTDDVNDIEVDVTSSLAPDDFVKGAQTSCPATFKRPISD